MALLGPGAPTTPVHVVHARRRRGDEQWTVASTDCRTYIRIFDDSDAYKRAIKGDAISLAAVLAHEAYHVAHGLPETPAYAEQLRVLRLLGATSRETANVMRAAERTTGLKGVDLLPDPSLVARPAEGSRSSLQGGARK